MPDDTDDIDPDNLGGGGDIDLLVPSAFSIVRARPHDDEKLESFSWQRLHRRHVIVRANGFTVRGLLHGADEESIYLRGELKWWVLPLATVTSIVRDDEADDQADDDDHDEDDATKR